MLTFFLDESCDDHTKHQAEERVGQVGVVQEAGGEVWAEQLERRLEDGDGAKEEIEAADNKKDEAQYFEFCVHLWVHYWDSTSTIISSLLLRTGTDSSNHCTDSGAVKPEHYNDITTRHYKSNKQFNKKPVDQLDKIDL